MEQTPLEIGSRFRMWLRVFLNLFFSSLVVFFLFWLVSTVNLLDRLRADSASSAHLLLVFAHPPEAQEVAGLTGTLEQIAGAGHVRIVSGNLKKNGGEAVQNPRILSVTLSLGPGGPGKPVTLADQVSSIQQIVKNDSRIIDVLYSSGWISRVDHLAMISKRIKNSLKFFLVLLSGGLALYWGRVSLPIWKMMYFVSSPVGERTLLFMRESPEGETETPEPSASSIPNLSRIMGPFVFGGISGVIALVFAWSTRSSLYPEGMDPFGAGIWGTMPAARLWLLLPALTGFLGFAGGLSSFLFPPPDDSFGAPGEKPNPG